MKKIEICVDKRTELMSVLLYISNYRKEYPNLIDYDRDNAYINDVYNHFSKFSKHRAIEILNEIIEKLNFCYDAPYSLIMQLDNDFNFETLADYPYATRLKSSPLVLEFLSEVKNFVKESEFEKFYDEHKEIYQDFVDCAKETLKFEYLEKFEEFFRIDTGKSYIVNFLPMTSNQGMYYCYRNPEYCILHFRNPKGKKLKTDGDEIKTSAVFNLLSTSHLRNIIEREKLEVPMSKDFAEILKTRYTPSTNLQFVCGEISKVLECVFHDEVCQNSQPRDLNAINPKNTKRIGKVHRILKEWRKSNETLDGQLQEILNLY